MNRDEMIAKLESSRETLLSELDGLPDEAYLEPGVVAEWTLKDLLAHLTMWEAQAITLLFRARTSARPNTAQFGKESTDELNARWYQQHRERALEKVLDDFEGARTQTIRRLEDYSDRELTDPKSFPWLEGRPLWEWIAEETFEHEQEHLAEIKAWKQARSSA